MLTASLSGQTLVVWDQHETLRFTVLLGFPDADPFPKTSQRQPGCALILPILARTQCTRLLCALYVPSVLAVRCTLAIASPKYGQSWVHSDVYRN